MEITQEQLKSLINETLKEKEKGEIEANAKQIEKSDSKVEASIDINKTVEDIVSKLAEQVRKMNGGNDGDVEYLKGKIFQNNNKSIKYPSAQEFGMMSDTEKIGTWYKAFLKKDKTSEDFAVLKGLSEGTPADGGNLVPTPLYNEVYRLIGDMAIMRRLATEITMTSQTLTIPTQTANPLAYWIGERVTKTTTSADFGTAVLTANKLVARILVSEELNDDAIVSMVPFINQLFAEAIARAEDKAFFTGTGIGQPRGISIETIASSACGGVLGFDQLATLRGLVGQPVRNSNKAAFVAHKNVLERLYKVKDSDGGYLWRTAGRNSGQIERLPDMLWGYPVYEQNDLADSELYFGDWSKYIIGDRKQLYFKTTESNETAWSQDAIDIKAVERVDGRAVLLSGFAKLTGL